MRASKYISKPEFTGIDVRDYPPLTGLKGCNYYPKEFTLFEVLWKCLDCGTEIKRIIKAKPPKVRKPHMKFNDREIMELKFLHKAGYNYCEISELYEVARYIARNAILDLENYSRKEK